MIWLQKSSYWSSKHTRCRENLSKFVRSLIIFIFDKSSIISYLGKFSRHMIATCISFRLLDLHYVQYCLKAMSQIHVKLCPSCAQICSRLEILSALNLSVYSYIECPCLVHSENPFADKSVYILVFYGATFFGYVCFIFQMPKM